jgi:ribosomal protein L28
MNINIYSVKVKHDTGFIKLRVAASSIKSAKQVICESENCPENAILSVKLVKYL